MNWLPAKYRRQLIRLLTGLIIAGIGWYLNQQQLPSAVLGSVSPGYYRVIEVADGDTISVDMEGRTERIRLIGVDTPETHDPRKAVQCFGQAATAYTKRLIGAQPVRLAMDELSANRDRYNRLLRYVYLPDGRLVQAEIIKNGYGFAYTNFPFTKSDAFKQYETDARQGNLGLWSSCSPTANDFGGYTSNNAN